MSTTTASATAETTTSPAGPIYYVKEYQHYRDRDNYPAARVELRDDEGYFTTRADAEARAAELLAPYRARFEAEVERARESYRREVAAKRARDAEIVALAAAGFESTTLTAFHEPVDWSSSMEYHERDDYVTFEVDEMHPAGS